MIWEPDPPGSPPRARVHGARTSRWSRRKLVAIALPVAVVAGLLVRGSIIHRRDDARREANARLDAELAAVYPREIAPALAAEATLPKTAPIAGPILPVQEDNGLVMREDWLDERFTGPRSTREVAAARAFAIVHVDHSMMYSGGGSVPMGLITAVTVTLLDRATKTAVCRASFRRDAPEPPAGDAELDQVRNGLWGDVAAYLAGLPAR